MKILAKEIKMIALFEKDGKAEPIRFKITDDNGEEITIKVEKITSVTETKVAGISSIIYCCQSEISNVIKQYEIKYRINEHKWELYKM